MPKLMRASEDAAVDVKRECGIVEGCGCLDQKSTFEVLVPKGKSPNALLHTPLGSNIPQFILPIR